MVQQLVSESIVYPESDGKPLADNTIQFRLITTIHTELDAQLPDTFVAADLLWYPISGDSNTSAAPDVMVAFGRPKGERRSYKQWLEDDVAPQVVFEIASLSNTIGELEDKKFKFYRKHGVEEYYLFDPDRQTLKGWLRDAESSDAGSSDADSSDAGSSDADSSDAGSSDAESSDAGSSDADSLDEESLQPIAQMNGWVSPRLKVRFEVEEGELQLYRPDGRRFTTPTESLERAERAEERAERAETQAAIFAERLRELGVKPEDLL